MRLFLLSFIVGLSTPAIWAAEAPGLYKVTCISNFDKKKNSLTIEYFLNVKSEANELKFSLAEGKDIQVAAKANPQDAKPTTVSIPNKGDGEYRPIVYQTSETGGHLSLFVESKTKHLDDDHHHADGEDETVGAHHEEPVEHHTYTKTIIGKNHFPSMLKGVYSPADTLSFISKDGKIAVQGRGYCSAKKVSL